MTTPVDLSHHVGGDAHGVDVFTLVWGGKTLYRVDIHHHHLFEVHVTDDPHVLDGKGKRVRFRTETKHLYFEGAVDEDVVVRAKELLADMAAGTPNDDHHAEIDNNDIPRATSGMAWQLIAQHGEQRNAFGMRKLTEHHAAVAAAAGGKP